MWQVAVGWMLDGCDDLWTVDVMAAAQVLLIEDEPGLAEAVSGMLQRDGFEVTWVDDGQVGYEQLLARTWDAAVVDVLLPGKNGFSICRDAREAGVGTPLLVLTAKSGAWDEAEALELGADDFLSKPFEPVVLLARLHALLRRGRVTGEPPDGLVFDSRRHTVSHQGDSCELSPREYQLLAALSAGGGDPVSKEELLNTVEVYAGYLRRKLTAAFSDRVRVETVRWAGYQLVVQ
jgi:DNA-binding response OmpR family regulator